LGGKIALHTSHTTNFDYPQLAIDEDFIIVTLTNWTTSIPQTQNDSFFLFIPRVQFERDCTATTADPIKIYPGIKNAGTGNLAFDAAPVSNPKYTDDYSYIVATTGGNGSHVYSWYYSRASGLHGFSTSVGGYTRPAPPPAGTSGLSVQKDPTHSYMNSSPSQAVMQIPHGGVLFAYGIRASSGRDAVRVMQLTVDPGTHRSYDMKEVMISNSSRWLYEPSLAVTANQVPIMTMHAATTTNAPTLAWSALDWATYSPQNGVTVLTPGSSSYSQNRWGDYTSAVSDPLNANRVMICGELTRSSDAAWTTRMLNIRAYAG